MFGQSVRIGRNSEVADTCTKFYIQAVIGHTRKHAGIRKPPKIHACMPQVKLTRRPICVL